MKTIQIILILLFLFTLSVDEINPQAKKKLPKDKNDESTTQTKKNDPQSDLPKYKKFYSTAMILITGGTFNMGCSDEHGECIDDEKPLHPVTVNSFLMGKTEVTQAIWESVMGYNPSNYISPNHPIESVSWFEAVEFCNRLSEKEGLQKAYSGSGENIICNFISSGYRLPTEAEWEFAARGGNNSKGYLYAGSNTLAEVGWFEVNTEVNNEESGSKMANELGLYDMSGSVWEWCWDWYGSYSAGLIKNPNGINTGTFRVTRGGSWYSSASHSRVAHRSNSRPDLVYIDLGFRLVRTAK